MKFTTLDDLTDVMASVKSTCLKREVTCIMTDKDNNIVSVEKNQCSPPNGVCPRLNLVTCKENYPPNHCNSEHAEVRALKFAKRMPTKAYLFGHKFYCDECEQLLKGFGIEMFVMGDNNGRIEN